MEAFKSWGMLRGSVYPLYTPYTETVPFSTMKGYIKSEDRGKMRVRLQNTAKAAITRIEPIPLVLSQRNEVNYSSELKNLRSITIPAAQLRDI